jgi:methylated-DNA-[protein]-cysteine S-methyltransferase
LRRLLEEFPDRPLERSAALDAVRRELDRYFEGRRFTFETRVDLSDVTPFQQRVLRETAKVPAGEVTTYTEVAARAGRPRAARAAGNALHDNPIAIIVPCHRVLRGDGSLGGYAGGLPAKEWLLKHEGALLI